MLKEWFLSSSLLMGWSLGANDSANIFGTAVASGLIRYKIAVSTTAVLVIVGAFMEGGKCVTTLGSLASLTHIMAFCALMASAVTMTILTLLGLPASSSQAVVGALVGIALYQGYYNFSALNKLVVCWVLTPLGAVIFSTVLYKPLNLLTTRYFRSFVSRNRFYTISVFLVGSYGAYCLGANNLANVTGVYIISGLVTPFLGTLLGGLAIALGVLTYSKKTMMTVGKSIVPLDPFSSMIAVLSEALTLHFFTQMGVPVSSSQAIVGGVLGVGVIKDFRAVNIRVFLKIILGWINTPIMSGILAWLFVFAGSFVNL